jgi:hypothetical protein
MESNKDAETALRMNTDFFSFLGHQLGIFRTSARNEVRLFASLPVLTFLLRLKKGSEEK